MHKILERCSSTRNYDAHNPRFFTHHSRRSTPLWVNEAYIARLRKFDVFGAFKRKAERVHVNAVAGAKDAASLYREKFAVEKGT